MDVEVQSFETIAQATSDALYDLNSHARRLKRLNDRGNAASKVLNETKNVAEKAADTGRLVERLSDWPERELNITAVKQRHELVKEFDSVLRQVRTTQAEISAKANNQQALPPQSKAPTEPSETTPLMQVQVLDQLDSAEVDLHVVLASEREHEIAQVQRGMREINAIFQDIGVLVGEQGQQLDSIEDNISALAQHTEDASRQLLRADAHQRSRGRWTCIALGILLVVTILVGLNVLA